MGRVVDLTGQTFGRLTVVARIENGHGNRARWQCQCACGNRHDALGWDLREGGCRSCGCLRSELLRSTRKAGAGQGAARRRQAHRDRSGDRTSIPEYRIWRAMRLRCNSPSNPAYPYYGGRGVAVCDRWAQSFDAFYADMGPRPSPRHSIDRIDNDGPYDPANCRWATPQEQARNRRSTTLLAHDGVVLSLAEWGRRIGIDQRTVRRRHARGLPPDLVLAPPARDGRLPSAA